MSAMIPFFLVHTFDSFVGSVAYSIRNDVLSFLFIIITNLAHPFVVISILIGLGIVWIPRGDLKKFLVLLVSVSGAISTVDTLKFFISRSRPDSLKALVIETSSSFPSAHAALSVALYFFLGIIYARQFPKYKNLFIAVSLIIVLFVGLSRIYLEVHYMSDVVVGWVVGFLWVISSLHFLKVDTK